MLLMLEADFWGQFNAMTSKFLSVVPNLLGAITLLIAGRIIARLASRLIQTVLHRLQVDALADRLNRIELVQKSKITLAPSKMLASVFYYLLLLIFLMAATDVLGMEAVSKLVSDLINYIPQALTALIVLVFGILAADFLRGLTDTTLRSIGIAAAKPISNFVFYFLFLNIFVISLKQAGIATEFLSNNLTTIIGGGVAAFALGYGIASKDIMSSVIASFYSKDKYRIGDIIAVDGVKGQIIAMDNTTITLQVEDHRAVFPLSRLATSKVELYTFHEPRDVMKVD